jgi:hypothetical protein
MHVFLWDPKYFTLLDNLWVCPANVLHDLKVFHGDLGFISLSFSIVGLLNIEEYKIYLGLPMVVPPPATPI